MFSLPEFVLNSVAVVKTIIDLYMYVCPLLKISGKPKSLARDFIHDKHAAHSNTVACVLG
jgi:hypothetical protein